MGIKQDQIMTTETDSQPIAAGKRPEIVHAFLLDGAGHGLILDGSSIDSWSPEKGPIWIHLDCTSTGATEWLRDQMGLDPLAIEGLLAEETRPRTNEYDHGTLIILRGVNLNPGADPQDMVSIRIWVDDRKIVTTRLRRQMAVRDIREQLAKGKGPISPSHFVARLAMQLTDRMGPVIQELSDRMSTIEDRVDASDHSKSGDLRAIRHPLLDLRRVVISLRRYLAPQHDAIMAFAHQDVEWIDQRSRARLRETADTVLRLTEELDELRERSAVLQDELTNRVSQRMEKAMYILTIVATIMLPLTFLTGLLGINVGGVPGADSSTAFWWVVGGIVCLSAIEIWLFKRLGWL